MDILFSSGTSVFAFLVESKLNLVAGIVLLAVALWSLIAIVTAFAAPPERRSARFGFSTALNVVFFVAGLAYSAVVVLRTAGVVDVASFIPADNAFFVAIVDLIALGTDHAVFGYALYSATALAVIAFIVTLARARRKQYVGPVAMAKDDGYILVDDGEGTEVSDVPVSEIAPATEQVGKEEITDNVTTEEFVEEPENVGKTAEQGKTVEIPADDEAADVTEEEIVAPEATEEEVKPASEEKGIEEHETDPVTGSDEHDESSVPISVARKRIADMGSVLGKLDDLFDKSAVGFEGTTYAGKVEEKPAPVPDEKKEEPERKEENSDPDSVEDILGRILSATRTEVKPASSVAKPIEKKAVEKPKKAAKPEPASEENPAETENGVADGQKETCPGTEAAPEKIVTDENIREESANSVAERRRAGKIRTIGRAAELFDEYLSAQSEEDKKKIEGSIDCIVVDKDKK